MKYAYQRTGAPILDWSQGPPRQSRAADAVALGSLGGGSSLDHPTLLLPAPGAPEPIGVTRSAMSGCSCGGSCGCGPGMGASIDDAAAASDKQVAVVTKMMLVFAGGVAGVLLHDWIVGRKR